MTQLVNQQSPIRFKVNPIYPFLATVITLILFSQFKLQQVMGMWFGVEVITHHDLDTGEYQHDSCVMIHLSEITHEVSWCRLNEIIASLFNCLLFPQLIYYQEMKQRQYDNYYKTVQL